jgi:hypothetical protein
METKLHKPTDILLCTCPSQPLLTPGCICELCMGLIADPEVPELDFLMDIEQYDLGYFEALERLYEDVEFAA